MDLGLKGANICIQGGSKGMGFAAAKVFASEGANVAIMGRSIETLEQAAQELQGLGTGEVIILPADISDDESVQAAFANLAEKWGHLNTLINAAGPPTSGLGWQEFSDKKWIETFSIGTLGAVRCSRAALPLLRAANWARIVNLSAMSTQHHSKGLADYTAAKSALISISKNMAMELAADNILVNIISPGPVMSDNLRAHIVQQTNGAVDPDDLIASGEWLAQQYGSKTQLGRIGHPDEIGKSIAFTGSAACSFMTGANINIDGGSHFQ